MQIKKILNSKEAREVERILEENYACNFRLRDFIVLLTADDKLWLCSRSLATIDLKNLKRVNAIGLYFGKLKRNRKIQLSIEGSMLVGSTAKKNVAIIEDVEDYMRGKDVLAECKNCEKDNFVIVKYKKDFLGSGVLREGGRIENILPKSRRMV
jgi:NOL1/NOP2/fmu family ribosome biogenesis protein